MKRSLLVLLAFVLLGGIFASSGFLIAAQRQRVALEHALASEARARMEAACATCDPDAAVSCCVSELPLTEKQKEAMISACADRCGDLPALAKASEDALARLDAALGEDPIDRAKVDAALSALCAAREQELRARVDAILLVRGILDAEQIEVLRQVLRGR